jgi:hypothetical protein
VRRRLRARLSTFPAAGGTGLALVASLKPLAGETSADPPS